MEPTNQPEGIEPIQEKGDVAPEGFEAKSWNDTVKINKEYFRSRGSNVASNVAIETEADTAGSPGSTISVAQGGTGATTLTGILKGNGTSAVTTVAPLAGTKVYYVADSSGGAVTRKLTFTDGILTSET
jgi:hypothetical protein